MAEDRIPYADYYTHLRAIPESLFEAASIDGASGIKKLLYITLPLIKEATKINTMLIVIGSLKAFDLVYTLTYGGPAGSTELLGTYMYNTTFKRMNFGYGSTIAMLIFILALTASIIQQKFIYKKQTD